MDFVAAILSATAVVWLALVLTRGGLLAGCLAVLLAGCCLGHPLFHVPMKPIPLTLDRVLWVIVVIQYAVWRRFGWADPKPLSSRDLVLFGFVGTLAISAFAHDWQAPGSPAVSRLTFFYLMPLGMYWTARQSRLSQRAVVDVLVCLAVFGVYLAITAWAEVSDAAWMVFPSYILSPEYPEFLGRARGPLLNPIGNGIFLGTSLAAAVLLWTRVHRWWRLAVTPAVLLLAGGVGLTLTRSVWIGAGLGLIFVVGLAAPPAWRRVAIAAAALAAVLIAATQWERLLSFKRDRSLSAAEMAESAKLRPILATVAWKMFLDRPLWGCGFGQYDAVSKEYLADRSTELPLEKARPFVQHNVFLALLTETGLIGMSTLAVLLSMWGWDACRLSRDRTVPLAARHLALVLVALEANYVVNGMFHDVAIISMVNMLLFFLAGMSEGLCPLRQEMPNAHGRRPLSG